MSQTVIKVENLAKQYRLGKIGTGTLSHDLNKWWHRVRGKENPYLRIGETNDRTQKGSSEYVWALKDVNFTVQKGEVLGIIGRNGAGKSTLLKILSRTTTPSAGRMRIRGRVASLLEVGTGFHPELTGRENVFLNGAIMGMTKKEIAQKFDEIVDFAGVERYIDTPVKRYSSGMYVRLAFGVAAHLEPEILIVDEVLAVGDAEFQKKCLGKMKDVSEQQGRTVLFVSHNLGAVQRLCTQGILMENGCLTFSGGVQDTIDIYMKNLHDHVSTIDIKTLARRGSKRVILTGLGFYDKNGSHVGVISSGDFLKLRFTLTNLTGDKLENVSVGFSFHAQSGDLLSVFYSDYNDVLYTVFPGENVIEVEVNRFPFPKGRYFVGIRILVNGIESDWPKSMVGFIEVHAENFYASNQIYHSGIGGILLEANWVR
jgi:lipopolysaccharide transport system ATP-binding protein